MEIGRSIFECLGNKAALFFGFARQGATFVYGNKLVGDWQVFAFTVSPNCSFFLSHFLWKKIIFFQTLPVIFFFSFMVSILYYYGAMQWVIKKMGCVLQMILGTTLIESVSVAANIFLGMTESPLVFRPYIKVGVLPST